MTEKLRQVIRREREALNVSQTDMAEALGISSPMLSRHERGRSQFTVEQAFKALDIMGCHVQVFSSRDEILWDSRGYNDGSSE